MSQVLSFAEHKDQTTPLRLLRDALYPLRDYITDPDTQEVMINAPGDVWVERAGRITCVQEGLEVRAEDVRVAAAALATANDRDVMRVLDCRMPGFRIAAVLDPIAIHGPSLCIRKHGRHILSLADYEASGALSPAAHDQHEQLSLGCPIPDGQIAQGGVALREFFEWMVASYQNFLVAGATGSGKTTFINALLNSVPPSDRVLTIEDTAELKISTPNRVMFEANPVFGISIRHLVKVALRYRPDRIVVGEVRGAESYDLLDALNTGHSGGGASIHANSAEDALLRLENLVRMSPESANIPLPALRQQIAATINYVVFCSRRTGRRGPASVIRLEGVDDSGRYITTRLFG